MKKSLRLLSFLILMPVLLSCVSCNLFLDTLEYDKTNNTYTDRKTGIVYTDAPSYYESSAYGDAYAKWKSTKKNTVLFYKISDKVSPEKYISDDSGIIFYNIDDPLPTLNEMAPSAIYICAENNRTVAVAEIIRESDILSVIDTWENGESISYPAKNAALTYRIKFESADYPFMYYTLIYVRYDDGSSYLYCRDNGRCVPAGDVINSYIDSTL